MTEAPRKVRWACDFCDGAWVSERMFMGHRCRGREKIDELRSGVGAAAYSYYSEWMKLSKRSVPKIETFAESSFYSSFIKFARHVQRVSMPNPVGFIRTMVENGNVQPALWTRDNVYAMYIQGYDKVVSPTQQFVDSIDFVMSLSTELEVPPDGVFSALGTTKLLEHVQKRKLSPWFLVTSETFREFMGSRTEEDAMRLEQGVQVGAMIMRVQSNPESLKLFTEFGRASRELGL